MRFPVRATQRIVAAALALVAIGVAARADGEDLSGLLRDAHAAVLAGRAADALALYARARRGWPSDIDATRGACEVGLKVAGDAPISAETIAACHQAFLATQGPHDTRNKVSALLAEKSKPDLDTIAIAALMAESARKQAPDQPWGSLARLDIARHLRRADLLATSRSDLQPFVATNEAVRSALADDRIGRPPAWVWLLRVLVLLGLAGTGVHALLQRSAAGRKKASTTTVSQPAAALLLALLSFMVPAPAVASPTEAPEVKNGQLSRYKIDDEHPEEAVTKLLAAENDPLQLSYLLQDLSARITAAEKQNDKAAVARYYHAMGLAAPTTFGPRKECETREALGDIPGAINACRELLTRAGVVLDDYTHFVDLVLQNPNPLPELEPKELENVISHLEKEVKGSANLATVLRCKVALRFEDRGGLERCRAAMSAAPANDPTVIAIKWGLAVRDHDGPTALALTEQARSAGLDSQQVWKMQQTTREMSRRRLQKAGVLTGAGVLLVAFAFFGARWLASSRRRSATRSPA